MTVPPGDSLPITVIAFFLKFPGFWVSTTKRGAKIMVFATICAFVAHVVLLYIIFVDIYYCHSTFEVSFRYYEHYLIL